MEAHPFDKKDIEPYGDLLFLIKIQTKVMPWCILHLNYQILLMFGSGTAPAAGFGFLDSYLVLNLFFIKNYVINKL